MCMEKGLKRISTDSRNVPDDLLFWLQYLFDEGEGDKIPGHDAVIHQLQERSESEGQHFTKAAGSTDHQWPNNSPVKK